jgi:hypothetical protein
MSDLGWWIFDSETQSLINRFIEQRVRFEGIVGGTGGTTPGPESGPVRVRFVYQDAEVRYPVLVTARHDTYGGPGFDHREPRRAALCWSIDHVGSAGEWRRSHRRWNRNSAVRVMAARR